MKNLNEIQRTKAISRKAKALALGLGAMVALASCKTATGGTDTPDTPDNPTPPVVPVTPTPTYYSTNISYTIPVGASLDGGTTLITSAITKTIKIIDKTGAIVDSTGVIDTGSIAEFTNGFAWVQNITRNYTNDGSTGANRTLGYAQYYDRAIANASKDITITIEGDTVPTSTLYANGKPYKASDDSTMFIQYHYVKYDYVDNASIYTAFRNCFMDINNGTFFALMAKSKTVAKAKDFAHTPAVSAKTQQKAERTAAMQAARNKSNVASGIRVGARRLSRQYNA